MDPSNTNRDDLVDISITRDPHQQGSFLWNRDDRCGPRQLSKPLRVKQTSGIQPITLL